MGLLITFVLGIFVLIGAAIAGFAKNEHRVSELSVAVALGAIVMLLALDLVPAGIRGYRAHRLASHCGCRGVGLRGTRGARPLPAGMPITASTKLTVMSRMTMHMTSLTRPCFRASAW